MSVLSALSSQAGSFQVGIVFYALRTLGNRQHEQCRILDYAIINKKPKWLVLWKGYPLESATWEPKSPLISAKDALADFEASRKTVI